MATPGATRGLAVLTPDGAVRCVDPTTPLVALDDLGLVRGEGVFETLLLLDGAPVGWAAHLDRMAHSAAATGVPLPPEAAWRALVQAAAGAAGAAAPAGGGPTEQVLRLTATKGPRDPVRAALVSDVAAAVVAERGGVAAVTLTLGLSAQARDTAPWLLGGAKTLSYAVNMASLRAAAAAGAGEAVWLSTDGYVLEAPTSTVLVHTARGWVTPPLSTGVLAGVTLQLVRRTVPVTAEPVTAAALAAAPAVALLSSVRGVAPLLRLDGRDLDPAPVRALAAAFHRDAATDAEAWPATAGAAAWPATAGGG